MQPPPKGITILTSYAHAHKYSEARLASHFLPQPNRKKYPQASHQAPSPWENLDTPASTKSIFCCLLASSTPSMATQPPLHVTKTSSGNGIPAIPASAASLEPHPTDQERLLVEVRTIHANLVIRKKSSNNATDGRNVHFYVHGKSSFQIGLFDKLDKFVHPEAKHPLKRNKPNYRPHNHHPLQNNEKNSQFKAPEYNSLHH